MNIQELTIKQAGEKLQEYKKGYEELLSVFGKESDLNKPDTLNKHSNLGRRCLVRTYSAGVHIGDVVYIDPENIMHVKLENSLRLWKWEGGGLSLSAIASEGVKGGRLERTKEITLTNAIEYIPTTEKAEKTYLDFIES